MTKENREMAKERDNVQVIGRGTLRDLNHETMYAASNWANKISVLHIGNRRSLSPPGDRF